MRILVVSDIHANSIALNAVREPFDVCLCLGDLVDYGADPGPCVDWVRRNATYAVRGNHDHAVAQRVAARPGPGFRELVAGTRDLQWSQLDHAQLKFLGRLPVMRTVQIDRLRILLVHGTPRDPLDEYLFQDPASWEQRLQGTDCDLVCCGHTHVPFVLQAGAMHVLNPGSVGQPRDGDPRAAYAMIEDGRISLRRAAYDISAAVDQLRRAGAPPRTVELSEAVWRSGGQLFAGS